MRSKLLNLGACLMLLLMVSSCSKNEKMTSLLEAIPAEADLVFVGDVQTIVASAGGTIEGSVINLPSYIKSEMSESSLNEYDEFRSFMRNSGINVNSCAAVLGKYGDNKPVIVGTLDDASKFQKAIEEEGYEEKDVYNGITFYSKKVYESSYDSRYDDYSFIAVNGTTAYWIENVQIGGDFDAQKTLRRMIENAAEKSFASTRFGDYITSGNLGGVSVRMPRELKDELAKNGLPREFGDIYNGYICLKGDLSKSSVTFKVQLFDEDGKVKDFSGAKNFYDVNSKISSDAVSYLHDDESLVYAVSLKNVNWDNIMDMVGESSAISRSERAALVVAKSYLEKIDGTIAIGFGVKNGLTSVGKIVNSIDPLNEMTFTAVCETKKGNAKGLIKDIKTLIQSEVRLGYNDNPDGLSFDIPGQDATIYLEAKDDILVLANHPIREYNNQTVKKLNAKSANAMYGVYIPKTNPLWQDLNIKNDLKIASTYNIKDNEGVVEIEFDGSDSMGLIERVARTIIDIAKDSERIEEKYFRRSNYYNRR